MESHHPIDKRRAASQRYKPDKVSTLFIAEAPPCADDRYFYFENVPEQDSLWIELTKAIYKDEFGETKKERPRKGAWLRRFCADGHYLIDAVETPEVDAQCIKSNVRRLIKVIRDIDPEKIILIKVTVYENLYRILREQGLPVVNERIPFPGSGQQKKFRQAMQRALGKNCQ